MSVSLQKQKAVAVEHVSYEINMFYYAFHRLNENRFRDTFEKNVFVEAFAIHARCLIDFLYPPVNSKSDDVLASDFFDDDTFDRERPPMHDLIHVSKLRANKEIAHITYARVGLTLAEKNWEILTIEPELRRVLTIFYKNLNEEKKNWFPTI